MRAAPGRAPFDIPLQACFEARFGGWISFVRERYFVEPEYAGVVREPRFDPAQDVPASSYEFASELRHLLGPRGEGVSRRDAGCHTPQSGIPLPNGGRITSG